ncbi:hypothetical protein AB0N05_35400 [Nocardia sp. NPDC051030]|uniref:hypothetical protein n=1 Tax=Nocardia sp. NPDC051030 TaxID=3155162 RepID=UPI003442492D
MDFGYLAVLAAAVAVIVLRFGRWRRDPGTRPLTVTLLLIVAAAIAHHPRLLDSRWPDEHSPAFLHLANWANLTGDLLAMVIAGYMGARVARAWMFDRLVPWLIAGTVAVMLALVTLWQVSDASRIPARSISELGGAASWYGVVSATALTLSGLAVCASVALARDLPARVRTALIPMALGSAAAVGLGLMHLGAALRHLGHPYADPPYATLVAGMALVCYTASGLLDHLARRPSARAGIAVG